MKAEYQKALNAATEAMANVETDPASVVMAKAVMGVLGVVVDVLDRIATAMEEGNKRDDTMANAYVDQEPK